MKKIVFLFIASLLLCSCSSTPKEEEPIEVLDHLVFSHESGFYDDSFYLEIEGPTGYEIFYTTDNSDPDEYSIHYETPIHVSDASYKQNKYSVIENISSLDVYYPKQLVDKCQLIKVIGIDPIFKEKTPISYLNYFVGYQNKDEYKDLPIITLNVNDDDLFDYEKGIYVTGKIYDESEHTGYPETYPANYLQKGKEWERPVNFKYFKENKELALEQNIGIRIHGGWSRAFNQKSFNLYAKNKYSGTSTLGYQFFGNINAHSLMLRSGGYRDTYATKIRDSLAQDFSDNEKFDVQRSIPSIVFLNGEYWGIYNLQERYSEEYVQEHHGVDKNNVLIIKNDEIDEGDDDYYHYYEELKDFFTEEEFSSTDKYNLAKNYIDMEEFSSYMATQLYIGNIDWPGNNVRLFKDVSSDESKWHFMMYDTDDSMGMLEHMCSAKIDPFLKTSHWKSGPLEDSCLLGLMLSKLLVNQEFKTLFRSTFLRIGSQTFNPQKVNEYLNKKKTLLSKPMVKNYHRFLDEDCDEDYFIDGVNTIQAFFNERYNYALEHLNNHISE